MTTFTTEDRENAFGVTINVEPIPFAGMVTITESVPKNEPVAWMDKRTSKCVVFINTPPSDDWIPLYTHPSEHDLGIAEAIGFEKGYKAATAKTLTDEEIQWMIDNFVGEEGQDWVFQFARAILRKAQEK
jgi:hypothetical protein